MNTILTFHQVPPTFLDFLFTFGAQMEPIDAGLAQFQFDDAIFSEKRATAIPELGRSGFAIRHSFLLRAPELDKRADTPWPWYIRQVAVYHSFDIKCCRSLWITVKGNDLLQKRIRDDTKDLGLIKASTKADLTSQWQTALDTHMIYFRYIEENWRWIVRDMEEFIRKRLAKAKTAPVTARIPPQTEQLQSRQGRTWTDLSTNLSSRSYSENSHPSDVMRRGFQKTVSGTRWLLKRQPAVIGDIEMPSGEKCDTTTGNLSAHRHRDLQTFDMFKYTDLQELNMTGGDIEELLLVIRLNLETLKDISKYFKHLKSRLEIEFKDAGEGTISEYQAMGKATVLFLIRLHSITRSLETRETQLQSLRRRLDEGIALVRQSDSFRKTMANFFIPA